MRPLALLTIALLSLSIAACGGAGNSASHGSSSVKSGAVKRDRDDDGDNNDDDAGVLDYGHAAGPADRQALMALIRSYYAAAAAADGAKACALLMPFIAEAVAENYGFQPGLHGKTCATVLSKLFKRQHALLAGKYETLKFYALRVDEDKALTVLSFATLPEVREIAERRDSSGAWRVLELRDGILE